MMVSLTTYTCVTRPQWVNYCMCCVLCRGSASYYVISSWFFSLLFHLYLVHMPFFLLLALWVQGCSFLSFPVGFFHFLILLDGHYLFRLKVWHWHRLRRWFHYFCFFVWFGFRVFHTSLSSFHVFHFPGGRRAMLIFLGLHSCVNHVVSTISSSSELLFSFVCFAISLLGSIPTSSSLLFPFLPIHLYPLVLIFLFFCFRYQGDLNFCCCSFCLWSRLCLLQLLLVFFWSLWCLALVNTV